MFHDISPLFASRSRKDPPPSKGGHPNRRCRQHIVFLDFLPIQLFQYTISGLHNQHREPTKISAEKIPGSFQSQGKVYRILAFDSSLCSRQESEECSAVFRNMETVDSALPQTTRIRNPDDPRKEKERYKNGQWLTRNYAYFSAFLRAADFFAAVFSDAGFLDAGFTAAAFLEVFFSVAVFLAAGFAGFVNAIDY